MADYKNRSFAPAFIEEVDAEAASEASMTPGAKPKSSTQMLEIAWRFYMEHKNAK